MLRTIHLLTPGVFLLYGVVRIYMHRKCLYVGQVMRVAIFKKKTVHGRNIEEGKTEDTLDRRWAAIDGDELGGVQ